MDEKNKDVIIVCANNTPKSTLRDYVSLGFGMYIGWNLARGLKYMLLSTKIKKD